MLDELRGQPPQHINVEKGRSGFPEPAAQLKTDSSRCAA